MRDTHERVRAALEHGMGTDGLAALGPDVDGDLASELLERMYAIAGAGDGAAADHYAQRLAGLASAMPEPLRTTVLIEVDMLRAGLAVDEGRIDEAADRARAVLQRVDEQSDLDATTWAEGLLGVVAQEQGRPDEAITRWDRVRRRYVTDERWFDAARAAASAARAADGHLAGGNRGDVELWHRWREAAELSARAGVDDDARICGVNASVYAVKVLKTPDPVGWDATRVRAAALDARAFARRFGADHEAAHLAVLVAAATLDLATSPDDVLAWTSTARAEYVPWVRAGVDLDTWPVFNDFVEGNAAVLAGDPVRAEPALRRALAAYERLGDAERARAARLQLLVIAYSEETGGRRARAAFRREDWPDADMAAVASLVEEHLAQQEGRDADAARLYARTRALLLEAGEPVKAVVHTIAYGTWRLERGDPAAATGALAAADACLAAPPPAAGPAVLRLLRTHRELLRAAVAAARGDRRIAIAQLAGAEAEMLLAGSGMLAARAAVQRGRLLLASGDAAGALAAALPAALGLDAVRFTFADAGRRHRWAASAADGFALAYRAAVAAGRPAVVAELIEVARASGVPVPVEGPATGIEALLADAGRDSLGPSPGDRSAGQPAVGSMTGSAAGTAAGSGATALTDHARTAIGPPARVRTPWGTVALAEALESARRYLNPVRADAVIDWTLTTGGACGPAG